jgi:hypothetical protein
MIRTDLFIKEEDRGQLSGDGPVNLRMPIGLKCKQLPTNAYGDKTRYYVIARARELAGGRVVCAECGHGPCKVPDGIGHDRELHIYRESANR